ncbi:MAG: BMP family protein, partial [Promethearchaeota archaeon]
MSSRSGLITSIVIVIIVFGSVGGLLFLTSQYEPSRVAMVTMNPGWGEMSRADQVQEGLESQSLSVLYEWIDPAPQTEEEAKTLIQNLAASGNYMLIVAVGEELADAVDEAAEDHPNQKFAIIGAEISSRLNVASATFAMEEGAFLAGATAAFVATNDPGRLIGILGTVETDLAVNRLIAGFIQGVEEANETYDLRVHLHDEIRWVGSYNDSETAYDEAMNFFTRINTSIIFAPVRASYPGIRQAMVEANVTLIEGYTFRDPYVIAAENHLDHYGLPRTGNSG